MWKQCRKLSLLWIPIFLYASSLFAQTPDTIWTRTYGGTNADVGYSIQQISDDEFIIVGSTSSFGSGGFDVYLIKIDSLGDTLWTRTYGGMYDELGYSVQTTSEGGCIITGKKWNQGTFGFDVYLIKIDGLGNVLWAKTYGKAYDDVGYSVQQTTDSGYIITGSSESSSRGYTDVYLIKTDLLGDTLWTKTYSETYNDIGNAVLQISSGGYIIAGRIGDNASIIKTDSVGNILQIKNYGEGCLYSVASISDTAFIATGIVNDNTIILKVDSLANTLWVKNYTWVTCGKSILQTRDNGYVITGKSYDKVLILRTGKSADEAYWSALYGGTNQDEGYSILEADSGVYIITGSTNSFGAGGSDVYIIKTQPYPRVWINANTFYDTLFSGQHSNQTLLIGNNGNVNLHWSITETPSVSWLSLNKTNGSVNPGDTGNVKVQYDASGLTHGNYYDTLLLSTNDINNPMIKIPVQLTVISPEISIDPSSFSVTIQAGQITEQTMTISNSGDTTLTWSLYENPSVDWLIENPTSDSVYPNDIIDITLTVNATLLGLGNYYDTLTISSNDPNNSTIKVPFQLQVISNQIWIGPSYFSVMSKPGETKEQTLTIGNSGNVTLNWSLNEYPLVDWLIEDPVSGSINPFDEINVLLTFNSKGLTQGTNYDTLLILSNGMTLPMIKITVKLSVFTGEAIFVYPNPFVPKRGHTSLTFANLPDEGTIEVYTISGHLVWKYPFAYIGKLYSWVVRTDKGKYLTSGVYYYVVKNKSGKILKKDNFSVIR